MVKFKVVSVSKQQRLRPDGGTTTVYIAWIETSRGATGSVEVSEVIWESDDLKAHLEAEAAKLDKAFDLFD